MLKELINLGLTAANVVSLYNDNRDKDPNKSSAEDNRDRRDMRRNVSNFRNTAYILRRLIS